jgi:inhibitor of KinA
MSLYPHMRFFLMGDRGLLLEFGDGVTPEVNGQVRRMALALQKEKIPGLEETFPANRSLLILYNPLTLALDTLKKRLETIESNLGQIDLPEAELIRIPVVYGGSYGPDLASVAQYHGISPEEVVRLHCNKPYQVYMIGFVPGYPYMGDLPEGLVTPRLQSPRISVPAGSVAIAQRQTGIYPVESPGGWQIIGRTPVKMFDLGRTPPSFLQMGNRVHFYPVTEEEFLAWKEQASSKSLSRES